MSKGTKIPESHRNEWRSKRKFEEAIEPWYLPFQWSTRDYGIDGQVEITKPISDSLAVEPGGLYFLVQLKCAEKLVKASKHISYSIPVKKIIQWYSSNLPLLLSLYDLAEQQFHSIWIDDNLISRLDAATPKWVTQKMVTIKITREQEILLSDKNGIKDYVAHWKQPSRKIIQPGIYFELKNKCKMMSDRLADIAKPFGFDSINDRVNVLEKQIHEAIYRVAITGPSRTGKSSLINAILGKKDVSPTGIFQTTGVPIQILPGNKEEIQILFEDGKMSTFPFSSKVVKAFASQDENIDNNKNVSLVSVYTKNTQLEKGMSLFDIPGLDDPIQSIYEHAWMILKKANAIFYLIDASVAANGGFAFKSEYKREILELSQRLDKIFLVFTKVNALKPARLKELKQRVSGDLKRLNLYDKIAEKVYYISAEESLDIRLGKLKKTDNLQLLENDLWQYLLKENKIGLRRLVGALEVFVEALNDLSHLLQTRLLDLSKKRELITALRLVENKMPELTKEFHLKCNQAIQTIKEHLENQKNRALNDLEQQLTQIPHQNDLPPKQVINNYLQITVKSTLELTDQLYIQKAHGLNSFVKLWIKGNFQQIWEIVSGSQQQLHIDMSELETVEVPDIDLSNSLGVAAITWAITSIMAPGLAFAASVTSFFSNLLLTAEERRAKRIQNLMNQVRSKVNKFYERMGKGYIRGFSEWTEHTRLQVNESIRLYLSDLHKQASEINIPITPYEDTKYANGLKSIEELRSEVLELSKELIEWNSSI